MTLGLIVSPLSSLVELIEIDAYLKEELKKFEGTLERDEVCEDIKLELKILLQKNSSNFNTFLLFQVSKKISFQ
jgi:hypothetical protein